MLFEKLHLTLPLKSGEALWHKPLEYVRQYKTNRL